MKHIIFAVILFFGFAGSALAQSPVFTFTVVTDQASKMPVWFENGRHLNIATPHKLVYQNDVSGSRWNGTDWKRSGDKLTYFYEDSFMETDLTYTMVKTWAVVGGETDLHDIQFFANGNALLMEYRPHQVDMSLIVEGGSPTATVESCVIQEVAPDGQLVWEWDSLDHTPITHSNRILTGTGKIDYDHCNSAEIDHDGNILISSRHLDSITKVNRQTNEVVWRLGGVGNNFTFVNDSGFSLQHDARRLPNGHLTLFDNGPRERGYSRAVEYSINETALVITRTWDYIGPYSFCCGNVQRLESGNTWVNFGPGPKIAREVTPLGVTVLEIEFKSGSYRSFRYDPLWRYYFPAMWR